MDEPFTDMLAGGHPNSLGRTEEVVTVVVDDRPRLGELFACLTSSDEVVRMRAGDALEKICRERSAWFVQYADKLIDEVGEQDQPSVQWHTAQILQHLRPRLTDGQRQRATELLQSYLCKSKDWIVLNVTMGVLTDWGQSERPLARWLVRELKRLRTDPRKSVAKRATKSLGDLGVGH
jgi:HEAT repeat protein